jgi:excisionase family DNA binding protein
MPKMKSMKRGAGSAAELANPPTNGALKLKPAAEYLAVSVPTMHRLIKRGVLRPCRQTRHLTFARSELDRFIRDGMT